MARPWEAENKVSAELAASLIEEQFPQFKPVRAVLAAQGWDNYAFLVNDRYIFRFPRRQIAVELLETESRLLPLLAPYLSLLIPNPQWHGKRTDRIAWPFAGYTWIPGRTSCRASLANSLRIAAAAPLATFLRELHTFDMGRLVSAQVPKDTIGRLDLERRIERVAVDLQYLESAGLIGDRHRWTRVVDSVDQDWPIRSDTLVHGDLSRIFHHIEVSCA